MSRKCALVAILHFDSETLRLVNSRRNGAKMPSRLATYDMFQKGCLWFEALIAGILYVWLVRHSSNDS